MTAVAAAVRWAATDRVCAATAPERNCAGGTARRADDHAGSGRTRRVAGRVGSQQHLRDQRFGGREPLRRQHDADRRECQGAGATRPGDVELESGPTSTRKCRRAVTATTAASRGSCATRHQSCPKQTSRKTSAAKPNTPISAQVRRNMLFGSGRPILELRNVVEVRARSRPEHRVRLDRLDGAFERVHANDTAVVAAVGVGCRLPGALGPMTAGRRR